MKDSDYYFPYHKNVVKILEILEMDGRLVWTIPMVVVYNLYAKTDHLTLSGHQGSHATRESGAMTCRLAKVLNLFMQFFNLFMH